MLDFLDSWLIPSILHISLNLNSIYFWKIYMYKKKEMKITMPPLKEGYVTVTVTVWAEIMNFLRLANYHQDMLCKCTLYNCT